MRSTALHTVAHIEQAMHAIELAMASSGAGPIPFHSPTTLGSLLPEEREAAEQLEASVYRERPEQAAVHFCLLSANALLEVAQTLLTRDRTAPPQDREREWNKLIVDTKKAGRAAYRAALVLTDTKRAA